MNYVLFSILGMFMTLMTFYCVEQMLYNFLDGKHSTYIIKFFYWSLFFISSCFNTFGIIFLYRS